MRRVSYTDSFVRAHNEAMIGRALSQQGEPQFHARIGGLGSTRHCNVSCWGRRSRFLSSNPARILARSP